MERVDGKFMLKIAFCDDDLEILKELGILLDKYKKERDEDLTYTAVSYTHLKTDLVRCECGRV